MEPPVSMQPEAGDRSQRASSPAVGILLISTLTVLAAASVGMVVTTAPSEPPPTATIDLSVDATADQLTFTHRHGDPIDLSDTTVTVSVNGEPLAKQPPVPFFAARGFESGPTGPFNSASDTTWRAGETATLQIASTNQPPVTTGDRITVRLDGETGHIVTIIETA